MRKIISKNFWWFCIVFMLCPLIFAFQTENLNHNQCGESPPWGFYGHRKINRMAVFTLPPEMIVFYKKNIEYLTKHAVDPDMRRYASKHEAVRHYMDMDVHGTFPFDHIPRGWTDALMKFTQLYIINSVGDTSRLILEDYAEADSFQYNGYSYSIQDYQKTFFINNVLSEYYEDEWIISCDSLHQYFGANIDCQQLFAVDTFTQYGILPYHLQHYQNRLKNAFIDRDQKKILQLSAEFGHYIADGHVPLHTTVNYNGQLTDQKGIHAFWESRLPELYADREYDFWVGKAQHIDDPRDYYWDVVLTSHSYVDSVLLIERDLFQKNGDQKYCYDQRGELLVRTECIDYANTYHDRMDGMVEKRMRDAILAVGSAWYTAWVDAGQPNLATFDAAAIAGEGAEELERKFKDGKIFGRSH